MEGQDTSNRLIDWIASQTFTPDCSIPVTGLISQINYTMDENPFGDV
jgi:hypothetical protein